MKRLYARINRNKVAEIIKEIDNIDNEFHPDFVKALVEITSLQPMPELGWIYVDGEFSPRPPPVYTPVQQMQSAAYLGCNVVFLAKPELSAKYYAYGTPWQQMRDQVLYIVSYGEFSASLSELHLPVHDNVEVVFTNTDDFKKVVKAIGDWLTMWQAFVNGKTQSPPEDTVTIE
jgi:hypothetical protein